MSPIDIKKSIQRGVSRRGFLKKTTALAGAGLLAGANLNATQPRTPETAGVTECGSVAGYCGEGDWLGTSPVIADLQITRIIDVDVLVLGGGHAGLLAALGASDKGAKVAVIEMKDETGFKEGRNWVGQHIGHVNSKWLIGKGYGPYDTGEITEEFVKRANGRCDPKIISLFVENSGAMFDRMVAIYEEYKAQRKADDSAVTLRSFSGSSETHDLSNIMQYVHNQVQKDRAPKDYPIVIGGYKTWPCTAQFMTPPVREEASTPSAVTGGGTSVRVFGAASSVSSVSVLGRFERYTMRKALENGADWYCEHEAVVLTQDAGGAVTGAIVRDKSKNYLRFNARKGVIVTTGDFSGNKDMCWALMHEDIERLQRLGVTRESFKAPGTGSRSGIGHKMCCWAGGMIEPSPRAVMSYGAYAAKNFPWGLTPMLLLNAEAKRFANEAAAFPLGHIIYRQPVGDICLVTDRNYMKSIVMAGVEHGGPDFSRPELAEYMQEDMATKVVAAGPGGCMVRGISSGGKMVYGANTLEELAGYLGYTGDLIQTFIESIHRYNTLCHKGDDTDFGKEARAMIPVEEPPFYGCKNPSTGPRFDLPTLCGLMTDRNLRVLDKASKPIKGLYVAGNTLGGRYGGSYSTPLAGNTIGMAMTHGWLAGRFAAES